MNKKDKAWADMEAGICGEVWRWVHRYGGEWDEALSVAGEAFCEAWDTYDPARGASLFTRTISLVRWRLMDILKTRSRHAPTPELLWDPEDHRHGFRDRLAEVSEEAQSLFHLLMGMDRGMDGRKLHPTSRLAEARAWIRRHRPGFCIEQGIEELKGII